MPQIILPMAVLAFWTMLMLALVPLTRIRAAREGLVKAKDFRYGESPNVPDEVTLPNRNYMNLLELPVLFYACCVTALASGMVDQVLLWLAWLFVAFRIVHSIVHLSYNNVIHRLAAFGGGMIVLVAMWLRVAAWGWDKVT
jgi:hypothetical protein